MEALRSSGTSAVDMAKTIKACGCEDAIFERLTGVGAKNYSVCAGMECLSGWSGAIFTLTNQAGKRHAFDFRRNAGYYREFYGRIGGGDSMADDGVFIAPWKLGTHRHEYEYLKGQRRCGG